MEEIAPGYSVTIRFVPGEGFYVEALVGGQAHATPGAFVSLEHAACFVARHLGKAGYTVALPE